MTIRQLEYFLVSAGNLNFSQTARHFFISQSAITQQIRNLEQELGVELFHRNKKKISLTSAGQVFVSEAEGIIERINDAIDRVHDVQNGRIGNLNIGYLKSIEKGRFPATIVHFHKKYPGINLNLNRDDAVTLHDDFVLGRYDVIFNVENDLITYGNAVKKQLGRFHLHVVLPAGHRLARRSVIEAEDLRYEKIIIHHFHRIGNKKDMEREAVKFLPPDIVSNIIRAENDIETIMIMVAAGIGIAIVPNFELLHAYHDLDTVSIPLNTGDFREVISLYYDKDNTNPLLPLFLDEVKSGRKSLLVDS